MTKWKDLTILIACLWNYGPVMSSCVIIIPFHVMSLTSCWGTHVCAFYADCEGLPSILLDFLCTLLLSGNCFLHFLGNSGSTISELFPSQNRVERNLQISSRDQNCPRFVLYLRTSSPWAWRVFCKGGDFVLRLVSVRRAEAEGDNVSACVSTYMRGCIGRRYLQQ